MLVLNRLDVFSSRVLSLRKQFGQVSGERSNKKKSRQWTSYYMSPYNHIMLSAEAIKTGESTEDRGATSKGEYEGFAHRVFPGHVNGL